MIRSRAVVAAALAAFAGLACTKANSTAPGIRLRQPSDLAVFRGLTLQSAGKVHPYLAVANASRNDLTVVDGVTDEKVASPIQLRALVLPVPDRPSLLAAASLGDDVDPTDTATARADLLLAVSGGDSVLQLVETWDPKNVVHSDDALAVDLAQYAGPGVDILALTAMPSGSGTARIAAVLSDRRIAIVTYARVTGGEAIAPVLPPLIAQLPFQPEAIAAMPPEVAGGPTTLFVATRDEVAPGVFGVAELGEDLSVVQAIDARAPTRLVAAARLQERKPDSAASDASAFEGQPRVRRVYAVLDESGCGLGRRIDCGIVTLDPDLADGQTIPKDYAGRMPYREPIRTPGRTLRIVVSGPTAVAPPAVEGEPAFPAGVMRLYMGKIARATTAVGAVAVEDGYVYFLDLGRFERLTSQPIVESKSPGTPRSNYVSDRRLWIQNPADGTFAGDSSAASPYITVTPGFTGDETWTVVYQGALPNLALRSGEAGELAPGQPWLALQVGDGAGGGTRILNDVAKLWHPRLGVRPGDILVVKAAGMPPGCIGTNPPGTPPGTDPATIQKEFELRVADLLPPAPAYPGGAVSLVPPSILAPPDGPGNPQEWVDCYDALKAAATGATIVTGLTVTVRAQELVLTGSASGYAGRPALGVKYVLEYPQDQDEDVLAGLCPLADWDGSYPADPALLSCGGACDRAVCEKLVLARKSRRLTNMSVDCSTNAADTGCAARWPEYTSSDPAQQHFPIVNGPVIAFQIGVQTRNSATADPTRDLVLTTAASSGFLASGAVGSSTAPYQASGVVTFDRSPWTDPVAGYRFLVSYPADFVLDTTPSQTPLPAVVIR